MNDPRETNSYRTIAHRAVTEGVNLKYVEQMRQSLYRAADEIDRLRALLAEIARESGEPWTQKVAAEAAGIELPDE